MAFDEDLDARVAAFAVPLGAVRKKLFGGTGYLVGGNMMAGVHRDRLVLRLDPATGDAALAEPHVAPFDITGRPMAGWVTVEQEGLEGEALTGWLEKSLAYAVSLPPKS